MFPRLVILTVGNLLSVVSAGAPGDSDTFCLNSTLGTLLPAPLPSNAKILMDSFNYITLLSDEPGAVWQQVDLDSNNVPGGTTSVSFTEPFCYLHDYIHYGSGFRTPTGSVDRL
jgi:hypothetical protein